VPLLFAVQSALHQSPASRDTVHGREPWLLKGNLWFAAIRNPKSEIEAAAPIRIGRDVWFGAGVTVRRGVQVGDQAVLGAGAVADRSIPDRGVAVGVPARVVRFRGESSEKGKRPA